MVEQLLKALKDEQQKVLESFVTNPCNDIGEYNRRVGLHIGLEKAEEELLHLIRPKDEDD